MNVTYHKIEIVLENVSDPFSAMEIAVNKIISEYSNDYWKIGHRNKFSFTAQGELRPGSFVDLNVYNRVNNNWRHFSVILISKEEQANDKKSASVSRKQRD